MILNGRVMDPETKYDAVANVGIRNGRIAVITNDAITGAETIDSTDHPEKVTDNATYEKGTLPSTGIPYVVVNGTIVVEDSKVLEGVNPGQPIRFGPEKSRFQPITVENWTQEYYAAPIDFGGGVPHTERFHLD